VEFITVRLATVVLAVVKLDVSGFGIFGPGGRGRSLVRCGVERINLVWIGIFEMREVGLGIF
jgi:hypothetical protein